MKKNCGDVLILKIISMISRYVHVFESTWACILYVCDYINACSPSLLKVPKLMKAYLVHKTGSLETSTTNSQEWTLADSIRWTYVIQKVRNFFRMRVMSWRPNSQYLHASYLSDQRQPWNWSYQWLELPCGYWKSNPDPLKKEPVLSIAEPSFQVLFLILKAHKLELERYFSR